MDEREAHGSILQDIHMGLFVPLVLHTIVIHTAMVVARVTTTYKIVELGLPLIWLGIITAGYSLLPVFMAVPLGRYIDRGYDSLATRAGSVLLLVAALGFWLVPASAASLFVATVLLGVAQLAAMAGHQMISIRAGKTIRGRDAIFGYHMVAIASGQAIGPLIIGFLSGDASVPPTQPLFAITVVLCGVGVLLSILLRPAQDATGRARAPSSMTITKLLGTRGLFAYLMASVITITGLDLIVVYMPLLGHERNIDASTIGLLLAVRAGSSMLARLVYVPLVEALGRMPLTYLTMLGPAVAFLVIALPMPLWLLYPALAICGVGLGVSATLTLSGVVDLAPVNARAMAMSLRLTGNRLGQMVIPFGASLVATATGSAGVFFIMAFTLVGSAGGVWWSKQRAED
jgi:MFS family permease